MSHPHIGDEILTSGELLWIDDQERAILDRLCFHRPIDHELTLLRLPQRRGGSTSVARLPCLRLHRRWQASRPMRKAAVCWLWLLLLAAGMPLRAAVQRQGPPAAVCVIAPRVEPVDELDALGVVPTPRPRLVVLEPLLELRIERQGRPIWQRRGSHAQPILTPLDWPTTPIAPGELVLLRLQPRDAEDESFAHVQLAGASRERMEAARKLVVSLGNNGQAWLGAFERALASDDVPLAWALLFHPEAAETPALAEIRSEVIRRGCSD